MLSKIIKEDFDQNLFYVKDNQGEIRWVFPANVKTPNYLNLYNSHTVKSLIYKIIIKLVFRLGVQNLVFNKLKNKGLNNSYSILMVELDCDSYSIFTGTSGENRKYIISFEKQNSSEYFLKIPATESSKKLVSIERENLIFLKECNFKDFITPSVYPSSQHFVVKNIKPKNIEKNTKFRHAHASFIKEIYKKTARSVFFTKTDTFSEVSRNLNFLESFEYDNHNNLHQKIFFIKRKLFEIIKNIKSDEGIFTSFAHKDLTPWNTFLSQDKLYVYDWELASFDTPLLFDLIHFNFQSNILLGQKPYYKIDEAINQSLKNKNIEDVINEYSIDINESLNLYLLINVSYYCVKYLNQKKLHMQAYWLIDIWYDALKKVDLK